MGGQLEPLPLAAGQRGERLADGEVAEPDVGEPLEDGVRGRGARLALAEELQGLGHRHREHLADVTAAEMVLQYRGVEPLPPAHLAGGGDTGHHRQVGVDDPGTVAVGAGALGVGAEQRGLHVVGLRERLADRVEQSGVRRRVAPARAADRGLVYRHHPVAPGHRAADQRTLARARHPGDHGQHTERDVDVHVLQVVQASAAYLQLPGRRPYRRLQGGPVVQVPPGGGVTVPQTLYGAFEADGAARRTGTRAEVDHVVGDRDHFRLVLHDQHRVALVSQLQQQVVHPLDVVRVQPDRRLVEDVGHVGERRAELADHLGALGLAARQRDRRPVEREVAQADLRERVQRVLERGEQRRRRRFVETVNPPGQVADLHRARVSDADALDLRGPGLLAEPGTAALRAGGESDRAVRERPDVRLHCLGVLGQHRLLDPRDQPLVRHVDARDLHPDRLVAEEVVQLFLGELADRLVRVEEAGRIVEPGVPAAPGVAGDGDRALVERLAVVVQLGQVDVGDGAPAFAARAHAADDAEAAPLLHGFPAALERDRARSADRRDVEGERLG